MVGGSIPAVVSYILKSNAKKKINARGEKACERMDSSVCKTTDSKAKCWLFKSNAGQCYVFNQEKNDKKDIFTRRRTPSVS